MSAWRAQVVVRGIDDLARREHAVLWEARSRRLANLVPAAVGAFTAALCSRVLRHGVTAEIGRRPGV
jgi:hypothetical protein